MKTLTLIMFILTFSIVNLYSQPKFVVEGGDTVNWGMVKSADEKLKSKVKLWNKSKTDTLRIYSVKPGCGCTTAPLSKDRIPPNDYAILDVEFNITGYKGEVIKNIDINTSDPENRRKVIYVRAEVYQLLSHFPRFINFPNSRINKPDTAKIVLNNNSNEDVRLEKFTVQPEEFKINLKDGVKISKKSDLVMVITFTPTEYGRFSGIIKIKTNSEEEPMVNIPIHGFARESN